MGIEGIIVLLLVAAVLVLLVLEKVGIDAIGIGLIVVLVLLGYVIKIFDPAVYLLILIRFLSKIPFISFETFEKFNNVELLAEAPYP